MLLVSKSYTTATEITKFDFNMPKLPKKLSVPAKRTNPNYRKALLLKSRALKKNVHLLTSFVFINQH